MAYLFFPDDGSAPWRFDFPGLTAGLVKLDVGNYKFLCFNDDTYNVRFRHENSYEGIEAYTDECELLAPLGDYGTNQPQPDATERVVKSPDMMWGCAYGFFRLWYDGVRFSTSHLPLDITRQIFSSKAVLTVRMRPLTARYRCRIKEVENLAGVRLMGAALSGMAGSMNMASGAKSDYPVTFPFKVDKADAATIEGRLFTFGILDTPDAQNILHLYVVLRDGRKFSYEFNVTEQVRGAPNPMDVTVTVRGLRLEESGDEEGGAFNVSVDGWDTVTINIRS